MPRKFKLNAQMIQRARLKWWDFHYQARQYMKNLPLVDLQRYQRVAMLVSLPVMTVYGGVRHNWPESEAFTLAGQYGLNVTYLNVWYLTEGGWSDLERLWRELPEPVDLYTGGCVQVGELYTLYTGDAEVKVERDPDKWRLSTGSG